MASTKQTLSQVPTSQGHSEMTAPLPRPTVRSLGVFALRATIDIAAPPSAVLKATLAHHSYGMWNSFVPSITIKSQPPPPADPSKTLGRPDDLQLGSQFVMTVYMDGSGLKSAAELGSATSNPETITVLEELGDGRNGYRVAWKTSMFPDFLLNAERVQEMAENSDGGTTYTTWETFGGPLAYAVKLWSGRALVDRFGDWGRDLKRYVESR
ncbi:hypothetical protein PVAG01_08855 [Phlyctema vagabunda]|uniref:Uncharacterized protein n=1 Tax=Phlyctema vagabunda TaxID=108571 RepID=A0ABR4PAL7_9HELO